jgi:hypothetical protein
MQEPAATESVRRTARRTSALLGAVALIALVTVSGAAAASVTTAAASDVDVSLALLPGAAKPVAGAPFSLNVDSNSANDTASYTAVVSMAAAPPTVKMRVFDLDGDILLARVHLGDPVRIKTWVRAPFLATSEFSLRGQVCVVTKRAPRCSHPTPARRNFPYSTDATVSAATVVKGRFSAFARLNGQVLQRISVPVKSR